TIHGESIQLYKVRFSKGQIYGGLLFGLGWAITGACPGPLYALIGSGATVIAVTLLSAIAGTWVYGYFRDKLPHSFKTFSYGLSTAGRSCIGMAGIVRQ